MRRTLAFLVPGSIRQLTGGYLYARRIVEELRALGYAVTVFELAGRYPSADDLARASSAAVLAGLADETTAVIDGLALPGFSDCLASETQTPAFDRSHPPPAVTGNRARSGGSTALRGDRGCAVAALARNGVSQRRHGTGGDRLGRSA